MSKLGWLVLMVAMITAVLTGCSSGPDNQENLAPDAAPPLPAGITGPVDNVPARCGVQGLFWQNNWWIVDQPIQAVRNETPIAVISGTMTTIGNNQARLDSPGLVGPQILSMQTGRPASSPPFATCAPIAS